MANSEPSKHATRDALIASAITNILVPEILGFIRRRQEAGQPPPTSEEVIAAVRPTLDPYLARDVAFLAEHGIELPPES